MTDINQLDAVALATAHLRYEYNDRDDLLSMRRWIARNLSPTASAASDPGVGEPWVYVEPLEARFMRPAITVRLVRTALVADGRRNAASRPTYDVEHSLVLMAHATTRDEAISLGEKLWRLFHEGGSSRTPYRIPMWEFGAGGGRLDRQIRVIRESVSIGLDSTDEPDKWTRPVEVRVQSPRLRPRWPLPRINRAVH